MFNPYLQYHKESSKTGILNSSSSLPRDSTSDLILPSAICLQSRPLNSSISRQSTLLRFLLSSCTKPRTFELQWCFRVFSSGRAGSSSSSFRCFFTRFTTKERAQKANQLYSPAVCCMIKCAKALTVLKGTREDLREASSSLKNLLLFGSSQTDLPFSLFLISCYNLGQNSSSSRPYFPTKMKRQDSTSICSSGSAAKLCMQMLESTKGFCSFDNTFSPKLWKISSKRGLPILGCPITPKSSFWNAEQCDSYPS